MKMRQTLFILTLIAGGMQGRAVPQDSLRQAETDHTIAAEHPSLSLSDSAMSTSNSDLLARIGREKYGLWHIASLAFENPAVNQWRLEEGLTSVGVQAAVTTDRHNPDPRDGSADRYWKAGAETYTKYRSTTLWGHAFYLNGRRDNVKWNETSDRELLYPYLMADSIGGDLKREVYSFAGGYADHRGSWAWGISLAYEAQQEYRSVDPRPENVVGRLHINLGGMHRMFRRYYGGIGFKLLKYKQTNEITFKSELGNDKIFHLTGLATHYNRFAGEGKNTYYNGLLYGVGLNLYPSDGKGAFVSCLFSRFKFDNILSDLNKLPLASAWHNELQCEGGWMQPGGRQWWGVSALFRIFRRHGTENIFGDAVSSIYPQVGSNEMFADNCVSLRANGEWGLHFREGSQIQIRLSPQWSHDVKAVVEPYQYCEVNFAALTASVAGIWRSRPSWMLDGEIGSTLRKPYGCELSLPSTDKEMRGLESAVRGEFSNLSSEAWDLGWQVGLTRQISTSYAITLRGSGTLSRVRNGRATDYYNVHIIFSGKF